ncbi:hypothetical protein FB451DRAFT_1373321 [Mycena latifolia]|nr:hypothetical protein FB451DRAFT_1373321 [Mycena latifolia]
MSSLHARYACLGCPPSSRCAAFVASDTDPRTNTAVPRLIPQSSDEICILCHHPWIVHEGQAPLDPAHVNFPFRRGGCPDTKCGGFFADQPRWSFLTSCVCLAAWMSHHPVVDSINVASATSCPPVSGAPLPGVAPPPALTISAPAPISAYQGPPAAVTGSAGTRRVASALRTLPHNQIASSSSAASVHRGPRRGFPSGSNPFSSHLSLLIALWPLVIPGVHEPAGYGTRLLKAQNDHMLDILNRLKLHNLLITVNVPRNGIASAVDFTSQLVAALAPHRLSLAPHPEPLDDGQASQLNAQPFSLLSPTRRADVITFKPHPTINANIFDAEEFAKLGKKFKNPDPAAPAAATAILIFIAPRFGHVSGPIDCPSFGAQDIPDDGLALSHPCFAARVLDGLPLAGSAMFPDPQCTSDICPSLEVRSRIPSSQPLLISRGPKPIRMATPPPLPSVSLVRPRSSPENSRVQARLVAFDNVRHLWTRPGYVISSTHMHLLAHNAQAAPLIPRPAPPPQYSVLQRADMPPLVVDRDIAPLHEILDFQDRLRRAANGLYQGRFNLHAHDVATAARGIRTLLAVLVEADADDDEPIAFQLPPGVINCARIKSVASFFRDGHGIRLGVRDGGTEVSFGPGPERAVYRPDRRKEVKRSPLHIETRTWDGMPVERALFASHRGKLVHNKPLEYYPPSVAAIYNYELAARGYAPRQDSFCRDLRSWQDVSKMVPKSTLPGTNHNLSVELANQVREAGSLAGELVEKYASDRAIAPVPDVVVVVSAKAKAEQSKWYRQYLDLRKREDVPWAPKSIEAWDMASLNSDYFPLLHNVKLEPKCKALLLYVAPPPHLFLGLKSEEKRNRYFFIWMCIRRAWLCQVSRNCDDPLFWGLTSQQWRDILSGEYGKYRHPKDSVSPFDARKFWIHGGPLFSPDDIGTSEGDISPEMNGSSTGRLEPFHFDDDGVKALVLWDLGLCHSQLQLDRADEILFAPTIVDGAAIGLRRGRRADVFYNPDWNWNIPNRLPPWEKPLHDAARRHWLSRLLEIIRDWPCASKMAWFLAENQFKSIVPRGGKSREAIFCAKLGDGKLQMLEWAMVAVYYQGVFDSLGILAIGVTKRPEPTIAMEPFYLM